jgi:hypothetical protein
MTWLRLAEEKESRRKAPAFILPEEPTFTPSSRKKFQLPLAFGKKTIIINH